MPLYIYPSWYDTGSYIYDDVATAGATVPITAIINPNNGPVAASAPQFQDYLQGMTDLDSGGVEMIGYVRTNYGNEPTTTVKANIDLFASDYAPYITGIFLDEASTDPADLPYYQELYTYIQNKPEFDHVVINPGTPTDLAYFESAADTIVVFENDYSTWQTHIPGPDESTLNSDQLAIMTHELSGFSDVSKALQLAHDRNIGEIYLTDDLFAPNPWDDFPTFWSDFINLIEVNNSTLSCPAPQSSNTSEMMISGDHSGLAPYMIVENSAKRFFSFSAIN